MGLSWDIATIQAGIERFITEEGHHPSAQDFDETPYLPSARQIQRAHGGLIALRQKLGYGDMDFTKGELRKVIASTGNMRGTAAEDYFEPLLIERFGEPYVHTQKRYYKGSKNRYDFLVYAQGATFGIDIFTTDRRHYIGKNIRHKILRYKHAPAGLNIYFVLAGTEYSTQDVEVAASSITELREYPNMIPLCELDFIEKLTEYDPLPLVPKFISLSTLEGYGR